jgi:hypothetical protein
MLATAGRPAVAVPLISRAGSSHRNPVSQVFTAVRRCVKKVIQGSAVAGTGFPVCQLRELEVHGDRPKLKNQSVTASPQWPLAPAPTPRYRGLVSIGQMLAA